VTGVSSTRNVELVRSIGADHVMDHTRENYGGSRHHRNLYITSVVTVFSREIMALAAVRSL
jgi:hypothetical protein